MAICADPGGRTGFRICSDAEAAAEKEAAKAPARDERAIIGSTSQGIVHRDAYGGYFLNGDPVDLSYPNVQRLIQEAITNGPDGQASGSGGLTAAQQAQIAQNQQNFAEDVRQFDATFGQRQDEFTAGQEGAAADRAFNQAQLDQQNNQFNTSTQVDIQKANAQLEQEAQLANQAAKIQVDLANAQLESNRAQLQEQIRQADIADARERENMRFLERREAVAVESGNRAALQNAVAIRETISSRIQQNQLQRQSLITQVESTNAQIQNNTDQFNSQEAARVEQLNEARRQNNLSELRANAELIGTLAQNPSDTGKLAAVLRAGGGGQISRAIAEGQDLTSDESLAPLRGALGAQQELSKGPKTATGNFIDASLIDVPTFADDLGVAPEISELFNQINYTPGAERAPNPAATDLSQFFGGISLPPEIQAQILSLPPDQQAAAIAAAQGGQVPAGGQQAPTGAPQASPEQLAYVQSKRDQGIPVSQDVTNIAPDITDDILNMFINTKANTTGHLPKTLADGGTTNAPIRIVGEEGPEIEIQNPDGSVTVIPNDKIDFAADGGVFASQFGSSTTPPNGDSRIAELLKFTGITGGPAVPPTATATPLPETALPPVNLSGAQGSVLSSQQPTAQSVAETAQNPGVATGEIPIASLDDTRLFLDDVQRDALRRGGFTDPTQVSPLKVSAPGTSQFLKELSGSVAGTMGFGPLSLFFEELAKLTPQGVRSGVARRTA